MTPPATKKLPSLHEFFSPDGVLSRGSLQYEQRRGQFEMAQAVEAALKDKRHLVVEAGTGTGKTLAYLLPALRFARERGQRVIVSTGTKNLQEQLYFKDVPFLESVLNPRRGGAVWAAEGLLYEGAGELPVQAQDVCAAGFAAAEWPRGD